MGPSPGLALYLAIARRWQPLAERILASRLARGKEDPDRIGERRGIAGRPRPAGPLIWLHAASVGESLSTLEIIRRLGDERPDITVLVTTGTRTSAEMITARLTPNAFHQFVPVDVAGYVARFLDHWRPDLAIWTESETWPVLVHETHRRGIPMLLLNARMSDKSYRRWRWFPGMAASILRRYDLALAQDEEAARQLRTLGYPRDAIRITGYLKEGAPVLPDNEDARRAVSAAIGPRPVWFAASTHEGEDAIVSAAHRRARRSLHRLLLILAPRHPERFDAVAALLEADGWEVARRSRGELPGPDTDVYLADSMGEMGIWYRVAPVSLVCGSLLDNIGGHNPFEPAALGSAILHGPHMENFSDIYTRLTEVGAAVSVGTEEEIARELLRLQAPDAAAQLAHAAWDVASTGSEVTERALEAILFLLDRGPRALPGQAA